MANDTQKRVKDLTADIKQKKKERDAELKKIKDMFDLDILQLRATRNQVKDERAVAASAAALNKTELDLAENQSKQVESAMKEYHDNVEVSNHWGIGNKFVIGFINLVLKYLTHFSFFLYNRVYADASLLKIREWQGVYSPKDLQDATRDEMKARFLALDNLGFAFNPHFSNLCPYGCRKITFKKAGESLSEMKKRFMSYLGIDKLENLGKQSDLVQIDFRNKWKTSSTR